MPTPTPEELKNIELEERFARVFGKKPYNVEDFNKYTYSYTYYTERADDPWSESQQLHLSVVY